MTAARGRLTFVDGPHDEFAEEGDPVDDVPQPLVVGQQMVSRLLTGLQRDFDGRPELRWRRK